MLCRTSQLEALRCHNQYNNKAFGLPSYVKTGLADAEWHRQQIVSLAGTTAPQSSQKKHSTRRGSPHV